MNKLTYMVRVEGGGPSVAVHGSYESAVARATQLAQGTKLPVTLYTSTELFTPEVPPNQLIEVRQEVLLER